VLKRLNTCQKVVLIQPYEQRFNVKTTALVATGTAPVDAAILSRVTASHPKIPNSEVKLDQAARTEFSSR
jgi:ribosomal protein S12